MQPSTTRFPIVVTKDEVYEGTWIWGYCDPSLSTMNVGPIDTDGHYVRLATSHPNDQKLIKNVILILANVRDMLGRWPNELTLQFTTEITTLGGTSYALALLMAGLGGPNIIYTGVGFFEHDGTVVAEPAEMLPAKIHHALATHSIIMLANSPHVTHSYMFANGLRGEPITSKTLVFEATNVAEAILLAKMIRDFLAP